MKKDIPAQASFVLVACEERSRRELVRASLEVSHAERRLGVRTEDGPEMAWRHCPAVVPLDG